MPCPTLRLTLLQLISDHSLVTALPDMVPVRARRQIVYPVERLGKNAPSERVLQKKQAFALNHINRKLTLEPKVVQRRSHIESVLVCSSIRTGGRPKLLNQD